MSSKRIYHRHTRGDNIWHNIRQPERSTPVQKELVERIKSHKYRKAINVNILLEWFVCPQNRTLAEKSQCKTRALEAVVDVLDEIAWRQNALKHHTKEKV